MRMVHEKAALSDDRRSAATEHHGCACDTKCKPCRCKTQTNQCHDCGKIVGDNWTGYDNDRMSDRGRLWCDACTMRRELAR